jgi:uncharacterized membrane protein YfbV (UPF0208 family)
MIFSVFFTGEKYANVWPNNRLLNNVFKEGYIISALNFSKRVMPPLGAFFVIWYSVIYLYTSYRYETYVLISAVCFICFCFALHIYGLYYLGKKARKVLLGKHLLWYKHICLAASLAQELTPTYMSLAIALNKALIKDKSGKGFMEEL